MRTSGWIRCGNQEPGVEGLELLILNVASAVAELYPNGTISSVPDGDTETDTAQQALR
jgi:hypothetical protein